MHSQKAQYMMTYDGRRLFTVLKLNGRTVLGQVARDFANLQPKISSKV